MSCPLNPTAATPGKKEGGREEEMLVACLPWQPQWSLFTLFSHLILTPGLGGRCYSPCFVDKKTGIPGGQSSQALSGSKNLNSSHYPLLCTLRKNRNPQEISAGGRGECSGLLFLSPVPVPHPGPCQGPVADPTQSPSAPLIRL